MKRVIIASILGIAATVATTAFADGYIVMQNYVLQNGTTPIYSGITFGPLAAAGLQGQYVGQEYSAQLLYSYGGAAYAVGANSLTAMFPGSADGGSPTTDGAGVFIGMSIVIPGYTSGDVNFIVQAYDTSVASSYDTAPADARGESAVFTLTSLQTNPLLPAGDILNIVGTTPTGLQPFQVAAVPEPATFALAGLGAAALLIFRRRK